jgi:hypothetical protein
MGRHIEKRRQIRRAHAKRRGTLEAILEQTAFMSGYVLLGNYHSAIIEAAEIADRLMPEKVVDFFTNLEQHIAKLLDRKDLGYVQKSI